MFAKILIANRGEIACRVVRTARAMGIKTVAVYSDADKDALHVALADEAYRLGPPPAAESYLDIERIVEVCRLSGAEAVHPGYGFLSENPAFARALDAAGIVFVGPPAAAIEAMGLKDAAKALMEEAGVPVVPGYHGAEQGPAFLAGQAEAIGYPVLIKARAGGGGKGMRRVEGPAGFIDALDGAKREARAAFGDDGVLIERYVGRPRHVEVQVFADKHGNVVHLFERDCSLQRRHQKVIEEAPAPGMTKAVRAAMGEAAVMAARAIGYVGAGTVEFIADASEGLRADRFYFMEMNTRLQVEHPVTEAITGQDLVAWQLRVAAGGPLPLRQEDLAIDGHAIEARVYAEDPGTGFLPATGTIARLDLPGGVRVDAGVRAGDTVTPYYDPMLAKVVAHGPTRAAALGRLDAALAQTRIAGVTTNVAFLGRLCRHEGFAAGEVDTGLIGRDLESLVAAVEPPAAVRGLAGLEVLGLLRPPASPDPWDALRGWRAWGGEATAVATLGHAAAVLDVRVACMGRDAYRVDGERLVVRGRDGDAVRVEDAGRIVGADVVRDGDALTVFCDGETFAFTARDGLEDGAFDDAGDDRLAAPMPGAVLVVAVAAGDAVVKGQPLVVMEAMKMEHTLRAPHDGTVEALHVAEGDRVAAGTVLLRLGAADA